MGGDVGFGVVGYVCFVLYEKIKIGNCELLDSQKNILTNTIRTYISSWLSC